MLNTLRQADLKRMLLERRDDARDEVRSRIREGRVPRSLEGLDDAEHSDAHIQSDIELALIQMRAETLARIDQALARLNAGEYGRCVACHGDIADRRLRALPFAVRCQACEQGRENLSARKAGRAGASAALFSAPLGL